MGDVRGFLAGRLLGAPDPEQVVVELEGEPERPAEAAIAGDHVLVVGREQGAGLDRGGDERGGLAPDHVEVAVDRHQLVRARSSRCRCTGPRTARGRSRRTAASAAGPWRRENPRSVSRWRAIRERLNSVSPVLIAWAMPWRVHSVGRWRRSTSPSSMSSWTRLKLCPSSTAAAPGSARAVIARDRGVGEEAEQRPHPLAAGRPGAVEPEVVADHLVQPVRGRVAVADEPEDLRLGVGDELVEVEVGATVVIVGRVYDRKRARRK